MDFGCHSACHWMCVLYVCLFARKSVKNRKSSAPCTRCEMVFWGSKKTGDSGGALTFLLKPQVPKTKMKQWHLLFCCHFLERETCRRLRGMMTVKLHGLSCDECGKSDHHGLNQPTFGFWVVFFFKLWNLGKSFKSNHRFRFLDVLVTTCLG